MSETTSITARVYLMNAWQENSPGEVAPIKGIPTPALAPLLTRICHTIAVREIVTRGHRHRGDGQQDEREREASSFVHGGCRVTCRLGGGRFRRAVLTTRLCGGSAPPATRPRVGARRWSSRHRWWGKGGSFFQCEPFAQPSAYVLARRTAAARIDYVSGKTHV